MFTKQERSGFKYWFAHWCAYQMTALNLKCWRPRFLLHDIEKPWLKLILRDYKKVQKWHRLHNNHHLECVYRNMITKSKIIADWLAMVIDWECSRFTKQDAPLTARQTLVKELEKINREYPTVKFKGESIHDIVKTNIEKVLNELNLVA